MLDLDTRATNQFTKLRNVRVTVVDHDYSCRDLKWTALDALEDEILRIQIKTQKYDADRNREQQEIRDIYGRSICCRYCWDRRKKKNDF